ncbi:hypothetical protein OS493_026207 [Desmophyllum pertusum]|uniref:Centromere protein U n=1 Tax=Desmophyllum pertusum TaxID=174260 RepID=A0A9W9ZL42_9CNID|nr:hypothetical protein OS493_026207 [Desmophyllum pertusum]
MAAEIDEDRRLSQNSVPSFRSFRQAGLDRRRPSKRQTTVRSFKIKTNWRDGSSHARTAASSQESPSDLPRIQELSPIPSTPDPLHADTSTESRSPAAASNITHRLGMLHDSSPHVTLSRDGLLINPEKLSLVTRSRTPDESPNSIVLESAVERSDRTPSPSSRKPLLEKTPLSGPGAFKTRAGRKRSRNDAESVDNEEMESEYRENNFVRLFNADQGRKKTMSEITDLDVILTAIEEEALEIRNDMESAMGKQAVKEFFIQIRKSFSETIDIYRENHMLKADLRKAKAKVNKLCKDLLSTQQKRSRITAKLAREKNKLQQNSERHKVLEDFSSFLVKLEDLQKECRKDVSSKSNTSKLDYGSFSNLPSLLIEGHSLLTAANQLKSVNDTLQQRQ